LYSIFTIKIFERIYKKDLVLINEIIKIFFLFLKKNKKMSRILAIDFGKKRTGIAVTDEMQIIASGLTTVDTKDLMSFLKKYISKEKVALFLIGKPKQMDNTDSESEALILPFLKKLSQKIPQIPFQRVDERFTSKMAFQTMIDSGVKKNKRKNKALVDEISATIILQSYLYSKN
jgi:putative Holliday junction resolvase